MPKVRVYFKIHFNKLLNTDTFMMKLSLLSLLPRQIVFIIKNKHLALVLFFSCIFTAQVTAQGASHDSYQLTQVEPELYTHVIERTGQVDFARVLNISFKTAGFLTQLNIDEGDAFQAKQLLAALDISELEAEKNATYSRLLQAKRNIQRVKALMNKNLSSQRDLDDAITAVETTRASYRVANYNLDKAQVFAPFDGVVVKRNAELGEFQSPGITAFQVASSVNNLIARVLLTGEEIALVHLNQKVKVHLAYSGLVDGTISKIPAIADSRNHLFTIEVLLDQTQLTKPLMVGQIARILIHAPTEHFIYRLPIDALNAIDDHGQALITIEKNNKPEQQAFTLYKLDNNFIYLSAQENAMALDVITQGWNKLPLVSTKK